MLQKELAAKMTTYTSEDEMEDVKEEQEEGWSQQEWDEWNRQQWEVKSQTHEDNGSPYGVTEASWLTRDSRDRSSSNDDTSGHGSDWKWNSSWKNKGWSHYHSSSGVKQEWWQKPRKSSMGL